MNILYEDNHLIAVNKPFGVLAQGDDTGDQSVVDWVTTYLRETYQKPGNVYVGLLHRLDRPAGGVMLLAKTSKAAARVSAMFQNKEPDKTYFAVTERCPEPTTATLQHYLKPLPDKNIMKAFRQSVHGTKEARLSYQVLEQAADLTLIEVKLLTGRKHQIRVQLASIGCPIVGDVKYGKTNFLPNGCIALLAKSIRIEHPIKKEPLHIEAPLPSGTPWDLFFRDKGENIP